MGSIIQVRQLWWKYEGREEWTLKGVDLEVEEGEILAIVGRNGAGKSTLCMGMIGLIPHNFKGDFRGRVVVDGYDTLSHSISEMATKVGFVYQDPESQFVGLSVQDEVVFGMENLGLPKEEMEERLRWALGVVGMEEELEKPPFELSGGQKQRVALASVLAMRPKVLILDEPTSELDPIGRQEVYSVIRELKERFRMTIVWVEHSMEEVVKYADRVILLHEGRIVKEGRPRDFFAAVEELLRYGVHAPQVTELAYRLRERGMRLDGHLPLTLEEAYRALSAKVRPIGGGNG